MRSRPVRLLLTLLALASLLLLAPAGVLAERVVDASTPIVVSDDVNDTTIEVQSAADAEGGGEEAGGGDEDD